MICPKCNSKMIENCCIKCGYLLNGNKINLNTVKLDLFKDLKTYNPNYDEIRHNENTWIPFIFGMIYLSYCGHIFIGIIGGLLEFFLFLFISTVINNITSGNAFAPILQVLYILLTRFLLAGLLNSFSLFIDNIKIVILKKQHPKNYTEFLVKKIYGFKAIFILYVICLIIILFLVIYTRIMNGTF